MKTVKEVSELTGISIRALRYYDEIGLLVPTDRTDSGYRLYDDHALEKLKAILFLKELDIPLETIKEAVNSENYDYKEILKNHRENLVRKINRLQGLLEVADGMSLEHDSISFEAFHKEDAEKVAEGYLANDKTAQVLDSLYGTGVTAAIGKAIKEYYGDNEV